MKKTTLIKILPAAVLAGILAVAVASFGQSNSGSGKKDKVDTPPTKHKQVRDLDDALMELDNSQVDLSKVMKELDVEKMEAEIREAMKKEHLDVAKTKEEMVRAMKVLDKAKIDAEIQRSLKDMNTEEIKREVEASLAKVDMEKMKAELEKAKDIDLSKVKLELENLRPAIEKSMSEARKDIDKARKEITSYKKLVDALNTDGLLNKKENYKVEYKNKELIVNGKKLSAQSIKKYNEFLSGKKDFTLQKDSDDFHITN